jgi:hypothetical protein
MKTTPERENDTVNELEQTSLDPQATAPNLEEEVRGDAGEPRAAAELDEDAEPVDVTQD